MTPDGCGAEVDSKVNLGAGAPEGPAVEAVRKRHGEIREQLFDAFGRSDNKYTFGIGDLMERVSEQGLPPPVYATVASLLARLAGREPPVFGSEAFSDEALERVREIAEKRAEVGADFVEFAQYPISELEGYAPGGYGTSRSFKRYEGPGKDFFGLDTLMEKIYNPNDELSYSLGGFHIYDEGDSWRFDDPFDFSGTKVESAEEIPARLQRLQRFGPDGEVEAYEVLRELAPTIISSEHFDEGQKPTFRFSIPKEGPVRDPDFDRTTPTLNTIFGREPEEYAEGGPVIRAPRPSYEPVPGERPERKYYSLGDVEYRADLEEVLSGPFSQLYADDNYLALMALRDLEKRHRGDYSRFIDTDPDKDLPNRGEPTGLSDDLQRLGRYYLDSETMFVRTTPTEYQEAINDPELLREYFAPERTARTAAHELGHHGFNRLRQSRLIDLPEYNEDHGYLNYLDYEREQRDISPERLALVEPVGINTEYQFLSDRDRRNFNRVMETAQAVYEGMGPPRTVRDEPNIVSRGIDSLLRERIPTYKQGTARQTAFLRTLFGQIGINPEAYEDDPEINRQLDQILGRKKED